MKWALAAVVCATLLTGITTVAADPTPLNVPADYPTIQAAIDSASAVPGTHEVVVAQGTYQECIRIHKPLTVRSEDPDSAAISAKTILRAPAGSTEPVVSFEVTGGAAYSYLKGLTITGANSSEAAVLVGNRARVGIYRCVITGNDCSGIRRNPDSRGSTGYCTIRDNEGAGVEFWYCGGLLGHSSIRNNSVCGVVINGVAQAPLPTGEKTVTVTQNVIHGNGGSGSGGGVRLTNGAQPMLRSNTIAHNSAGFGAGIACLSSQPTIEGCIVAYNEGAAGIACDAASDPTVRYTCVFGNTSAYQDMDDPTGSDGNIAADPLFADHGHSDYHLKSQSGRWHRGSWVTDDVTSPCIDAGNPSISVVDEPAPNGGRLNMGAYAGTEYASKSPATRRPGRPPAGGR